MTTAPVRFLLLDATANNPAGHLPILAGELAQALGDLGCDVEVYFPNGWALENDPARPMLQHWRPGPLARWARRRLAYSPRLARLMDYRVVQHHAQRTGAQVIVMSFLVSPRDLLSVVTRGDWMLYQFWGEEWLRRMSSREVPSVFGKVAHRMRQRRRARVVLATNNDVVAASWKAANLPVSYATFDFVSVLPVEPMTDARNVLGLPADVRLLVMFGAAHQLKAPEVVWGAFSDDSPEPAPAEWRLLVAGELGTKYLDWCTATGAVSSRVVCRSGVASLDERRAYYSAADATVISYQPDNPMDSGSITDAVSYGIPIIASDRCRTGQRVEELQLGPTFDVSSMASFSDALQRVPRALTSEVVQTAQAAMSPERRARAHLEAFGVMSEEEVS